MSYRRKKNFPPGTFIPMPQRLMAIAQLCFAFSLLLWYMLQPFMGEYFALRSRMLLYEYAMGTSEILKSRSDQEGKQEIRAEFFKQLPENEQRILKEGYHRLQNYAKRSALRKFETGVRSFFIDIPPFELAWIFFSITISILILLKSEGAKQAAWLLPLIVAAYTADNQLNGNSYTKNPDYQLFPSEEVIFKNYVHEPVALMPQEQKEQLEKGWRRYLIKDWSKDQQENQFEAGEFNFTIARLKLLHGQPRSEWLNNFHEKLGISTLLAYLLWNTFFAWIVSKKIRTSH
jgi:hypothetical protein